MKRSATRRRDLLKLAASGLGQAALASLLSRPSARAASARAKRVIWLFMAGGPSHLDLLDHKPNLASQFNKDVPKSVLANQRLTTFTSGQGRFPIAPTKYAFAQFGQSGAWVSELLPWTAKIVDDLTIVNSMTGTAVNHDPAVQAMTTGGELPGKPSAGAWISYGLGSMNRDLPSFVVMTSRFDPKVNAQPLSPHAWSAGFLPPQHGGVAVHAGAAPVLYLANPQGVDTKARRLMLDGLTALSQSRLTRTPNPEAAARLEQYELAFRMQSAVPELIDLGGETNAAKVYGDDVNTPGTFAANCLQARRMIERGVRFVQIFHRGWDSHYSVPTDLPLLCRDIDQACYGLITDLKQRGLLEDTLVIWSGEFGRTVFGQGDLTKENYGRDHHPHCFSLWLAGGGIKAGQTYGASDDFGFNVARDPVSERDLHATILQLLGLDPQGLSFFHQGLSERLVGTGPPASIVTGLLA